MRHLDIKLLRTLVVFAKTGSFSQTAVMLHKTQSAITHQMHRLQEALGITIFEKKGRMLMLSDEGVRLVRYANQVLVLNDEVFRIFKDKQLQGTLNLGAPHDVVESLLPAILRYISTILPQISVKTYIERGPTLMEKLDSGELDMTIATRFDQDMQGLVLRRSPTVWLCASDYVYDSKNALPLILADGVSMYKDMALAALQQAQVPWEITQSVSTLVNIKALVRAGFGVTPRSIDLLTQDMRTLGVEDGLPSLPDVIYYLWIRPNTTSTLAQQTYHYIQRDWKLLGTTM